MLAEKKNPHDPFAVAVLRLNDKIVVGHLPKKYLLPAPCSLAGAG